MYLQPNDLYTSTLSEMKNRYHELTGAKDISPEISNRLQSLAALCSETESSLQKLKQQMHPQTATGKYLDLYANAVGITRRPEETDDLLRARLQ